MVGEAWVTWGGQVRVGGEVTQHDGVGVGRGLSYFPDYCFFPVVLSQS